MRTREEKDFEAAHARRRAGRSESEAAKKIRRTHRRRVRHNLRVGRWDDFVPPAKTTIELILDTRLHRRLGRGDRD